MTDDRLKAGRSESTFPPIVRAIGVIKEPFHINAVRDAIEFSPFTMRVATAGSDNDSAGARRSASRGGA